MQFDLIQERRTPFNHMHKNISLSLMKMTQINIYYFNPLNSVEI